MSASTPMAALAAALGVTASVAEPVTLTRLSETVRAYTLNSAFTEPTRRVVLNSDEWQGVWSRIDPRKAAPPVDFTRSMVLVAALGLQRSGGFDIRIEAVEANGSEWLVTIAVQTPAPTCSVVAALTSPADVVIVPRSNATITFRSTTALASC